MARGHRVTMITARLFEEHARKAGLNFIPLGEKDEFEAMIRDAGFVQTRHEPILGGLVAIHSGWKI